MIELQPARDRAPHALELVPAAGPLRTPLAGNVLACLQFGADATASGDVRVMPVRLQVHSSGGSAIHNDLWLSRLPVRMGITDGIRHADNGEILFGWMHLPDEQLGDVEDAACTMHRRLLELLQKKGFPHWLRAWNYLSRINEGQGDAERYRRFTAGRYRALADAFASSPQFERMLPAATGIGASAGAGLTIGFFAGRAPGIQVENPRQTSAFEYPRVYGPRSPSFSRATLQHWHGRSMLFVSGTASIVGHATLHPGDAAAQFEETLRNLDVLVGHAARQHFPHPQGGFFRPRGFKLYVRDPRWLEAIEPRWRDALAAKAHTIVLIGDLCRNDLVVEVEAVYELVEAA